MIKIRSTLLALLINIDGVNDVDFFTGSQSSRLHTKISTSTFSKDHQPANDFA
ncbi:MAG: hypothetical protein LBT09_02915 [Planctomycetaceae bacterium]|nr:hypothetical protein [Planctomycetaceae bacterium]